MKKLGSKKVIKIAKKNSCDCIPTLNHHLHYRNCDLKIIDFELLCFTHKCNIYHVPVYILTDGVVSINGDVFETMIRIGYSEKCVFLDSVQEQCFSKLEAYSQHKRILNKLIKGFYNDEIRKIVDESWVTYKND